MICVDLQAASAGQRPTVSSLCPWAAAPSVSVSVSIVGLKPEQLCG